MSTGPQFDSAGPVLETARLILRPYTPADAPRVLDTLSRLDVIKWLDNPPHIPMADLDEARTWITARHRQHAEDPNVVALAIAPRDDGPVAGTVQISRLITQDGAFDGEYEIGWHLNPDSTGRGYATEAAQALAAHAFAEGLDELIIGMWTDNAPSAAVARRLGAHELGVVDDRWYGGQSLQFLLRPSDREPFGS